MPPLKRSILRILVCLTPIASIAVWQRIHSPFVPCPEISGYRHGIKYVVRLGYTDVPSAIRRAHLIVDAIFNKIDHHHNRWNEHSELSRLNRSQAGVSFALSADLHELLLLVQRAVQITDGRFDPTIEPVWILWRQRLEEGTVPAAAELRALRARTGWCHAHLSALEFRKSAPIALDLGGIAKGHCVDLIARHLQREGICNFYLEWGGELRASGRRSAKLPWRAGVFTRLSEESRGRDVVELNDVAIATSGSDQQFWRVGNQNYTHIVDPRTLRALRPQKKRPVTCTVMAKTCSLADALATAGMLFPTCEAALEWFDQLQVEDLYCVWLSDDSNTMRSSYRARMPVRITREIAGG